MFINYNRKAYLALYNLYYINIVGLWIFTVVSTRLQPIPSSGHFICRRKIRIRNHLILHLAYKQQVSEIIHSSSHWSRLLFTMSIHQMYRWCKIKASYHQLIKNKHEVLKSFLKRPAHLSASSFQWWSLSLTSFFGVNFVNSYFVIKLQRGVYKTDFKNCLKKCIGETSKNF